MAGAGRRRQQAIAHARRAEALVRSGAVLEGIHEFERALAWRPGSPGVLNALANALSSLGRGSEAIDALYQAHQADPTVAPIQSNLLYALLFSPDYSPATIADAYRQWGAQFAVPSELPPHPGNRRLRVGYVSSEFRYDPEIYFIEPLLRHHDRARFEIFCYAQVTKRDEYTQRCESLSDCWRRIDGMTDEEAVRLIRGDGIDILVDSSGQFGDSRLRLFAQRAAPVQVSYPTYPATSGLVTMDYRITDAACDPPGLTESLHTERLFRLPRSFVCYQAPSDAPGVGGLPARESGSVTYGSFNRLQKLSDPVIDLWADILRAVPDSRLLFHNVFDGHVEPPSDHREAVLGMFSRRGIGSERLAFAGARPLRAHLSMISSADIALDTFPFNGMTTTCECLWMGVPVVTLAGLSHVSRVGVSYLTLVGLTEFIAASPQEYVRIAVAMGRDLDSLHRLRAGLRDNMSNSPLGRCAEYTRDLESAYCEMWDARSADVAIRGRTPDPGSGQS